MFIVMQREMLCNSNSNSVQVQLRCLLLPEWRASFDCLPRSNATRMQQQQTWLKRAASHTHTRTWGNNRDIGQRLGGSSMGLQFGELPVGKRQPCTSWKPKFLLRKIGCCVASDGGASLPGSSLQPIGTRPESQRGSSDCNAVVLSDLYSRCHCNDNNEVIIAAAARDHHRSSCMALGAGN